MQKWKNLFVPSQNAAGKQLRRALAASVFSLLMSCTCLVGTTFAWFNDFVGTEYLLRIGTFSAEAYMTQNVTGDRTPLTGSTVLPAGPYTLVIEPEYAKNGSIGYCVLSLAAQESGMAREVYYTHQISSVESERTEEIRFDVFLNEFTAVSICSVWGELECEPSLRSNCPIFYGRARIVETEEEEKTGEEELPQDTPAQDAPTQDAPAQDAPAQDAPAQDAPAQDAPAQDAPAQDTPAQDTPAQDTSAQDTPAQDTSAQDTPTQDAPAQDAPAQDTPAQDAPAQDAPAQDAPAQDTPKQDAPTLSAPSENEGISAESVQSEHTPG